MSMIGKTLGNFEITGQLGKGGMGEVYQAKDRKLGRDVAIKVLPEEFARDADRVARFQREAKLLASLNHTNIAAIYGLEESGGTNFLVLELVEGDTLADRIKTGPIPVEESLKLALQIAEALEAAHEKGVIHRDLKPANIKVTPDGKVKVLDFGLAKAFAGEQAELNLSNSPTLSNAATQQGVILGTAAYMSPEQARGKAVDKRTDIWAFGCVLYEMLTGRQTWTGITVTDIMAAALAKDPDFDSLPPDLHPDIRKLLTRCLQKEPTERFRDIGDVRVEIKQVLANPKGVLLQPVTAVEHRTGLRQMLPWVVGTAVLAAIIAGVAVWNLRKPEPRRVIRFDYDLPEDQQLNNTGNAPVLAVSRDGSKFVYSTTKGLFLRSMNELEAKPVFGTDENPQSPFFSPDGQWIGYRSGADNKLKKIAISGGESVALCDATRVVGAIWYADNTIVYSDLSRGIMRVSANGGIPETLVKGTTVAPQLLPGGEAVIFTDISVQPYKIMVQLLNSGERKALFEGVHAQYLTTGHIVNVSERNLFAAPFDLDTLKVSGGLVRVIEGLGYPAFSDSGTLVYAPGLTGSTTRLALVWVDRGGQEEKLEAPYNMYTYSKISPDGTKVALTVTTGGNGDIWIWDLSRKTMTRLTFDEGNNSFPLWTRDGKRIVFSSLRDGKYSGVYWKAADGTGKAEPFFLANNAALYPASLSGDGNTLVLMRVEKSIDIVALSMEGNRASKVLLQEKYNEVYPEISPDGRWMAYQSDESGKYEVYVRPFPDVNRERWQVSAGGGENPTWSPSGKELFYRSDDSIIMAVAVKTEKSLSLGIPASLFRGKYSAGNFSTDGKRFLMIKPSVSTNSVSAAKTTQKINIVLNWFEELKQRVPTGK